MTTDHDPRELRAAEDVARAALVPGSRLTHEANCAAWTLAKAWLATVRDDDGEEQPDTTIPVCNNTAIMSDIAGVFVRDRQGTYSMIRKGRPTRGQFRALCRGLGITPAAATPETPG